MNKTCSHTYTRGSNTSGGGNGQDLVPLSSGDSFAHGGRRRRVGDGMWFFDPGTGVGSPYSVLHHLGCEYGHFIDSGNNPLNVISCNAGFCSEFDPESFGSERSGSEEFDDGPSERRREHDDAKIIDPGGSATHHGGARGHDDRPAGWNGCGVAHLFHLRGHRDRWVGQDALSLHTG